MAQAPSAPAAAAAPHPVTATIRAYQVGFGDCFLLSIAYDDDSARHILIDFGSPGLPKDAPTVNMMRVAEDIRDQCGGKLAIVVAPLERDNGFDRHWPLAARRRFVGEDNIKNDAAVKNLMTMAEDPSTNLYV